MLKTNGLRSFQIFSQALIRTLHYINPAGTLELRGALWEQQDLLHRCQAALVRQSHHHQQHQARHPEGEGEVHQVVVEAEAAVGDGNPQLRLANLLYFIS